MGLFSWLSGKLSSDIAIDLGTSNTLIYSKGKGIVLNEPSIVAINPSNGKVQAVGITAKEMLGKTPSNIIAVKPMRDGVIADFECAEKMLEYFIMKGCGRNTILRPKIIIAIPTEITQVESKAVKEAAMRAKASEVHLVYQPMAAAIGAELPIEEPAGNIIVDIGGGTTDVAVISLYGVVISRSIRVAGNEMDEAIIQYLKKKYNLLIGEKTAELIKIEIGTAYPLEESKSIEIKGRDLKDGIPKTIVVNDSEIREALSDVVEAIIECIRSVLEKTPPELAADIVDRGIVLTGGGSLLKNLDKRIREETMLPVFLTENPLTTVVLGAGKLLENKELLEKITIG
ncbi:MAG: rod shape-determining protein [Candidatus Aminicenantia bacterium]